MCNKICLKFKDYAKDYFLSFTHSEYLIIINIRIFYYDHSLSRFDAVKEERSSIRFLQLN